MADKGVALMGVGTASGEHKTVEAAQRAISSPLLDEVSIAGATSVLINITGNTELTMYEINEASSLIQEEAHEDVNVIWGWVVDETWGRCPSLLSRLASRRICMPSCLARGGGSTGGSGRWKPYSFPSTADSRNGLGL